MSVRVRNQIVVVASLDSDEKSVHFERQDKTLTSVVATYDAEESGQVVLAASEVNYTLPMGKVASGALLYIESDQELVVRLDGEVVGHKITPTTATKAKLFIHTQFSAAPIISNNTTNEAQVAYLIAGSKA
jgi:hypothetical protein